MDDLQFAYVKKRCVEDATLSIIDYVFRPVDGVTRSTKHNTKILFVDINTIQPLVLMKKAYSDEGQCSYYSMDACIFDQSTPVRETCEHAFQFEGSKHWSPTRMCPVTNSFYTLHK